MTIFEKMNGSKIEVKYETGAHYKITYLSESELKWEALSEVSEGKAEVGINPYWTTNILEWNKGGHFSDSDLRVAKAFVWCIENI